MKKKRRDVKKDSKIKVNLPITLVLIISLIYFLGLDSDLNIEESFAGESTERHTVQNSFISKCVEKLGKNCVIKLLRSPVIASDFNDDHRYKRLHPPAYKQSIRSVRARWTKWGWRCNKNADCRNQKYKGEGTRCRKKVKNRRFSSKYKYCLAPSQLNWQCGKGQCGAEYTCRRGQVRNKVTKRMEWWRNKNGKLGTQRCRTPARVGWKCDYNEQCKSNSCINRRCGNEKLNKDPYQNLKLYGELINRHTKYFLALLDKKYSGLNRGHQYDLIDAIDSGDKILKMSERIVGREIPPLVFLNDFLAVKSHLIFTIGDEVQEDEDEGPTLPRSGGDQGEVNTSVGGSSGGGSGSTFLDCVKQSSGPGSVTPTPDVGGSPGGPTGTTPSGPGTGEDPMLNSGSGTGIGKNAGELICGPGGNIEGPKGGGLTQEGTQETDTAAQEAEDTPTAVPETIEQEEKAAKEAAAQEEKTKEAAIPENMEGVSKVFEVEVSDHMSVGAMKYSDPLLTPGEKAYFKSQGGKNPTYYGAYIRVSWYDPEPETSPAGEGQFELDCGDGNVFLCMSSNKKGKGKGACYEAELDPHGHPDPDTIKPCGDDVPADAISWPVNYLVDPVPYLQHIQQQTGTFQTLMLYQTIYLKGNYDEASGFDNN